MIQRAESFFDTGRMHYEAGEMAVARAEFDRAIEVLLTAHGSSANHQAIDRKLSELIEEIYRFDVSGQGASEVSSEPGFDTSPLDEIPELTFPIDPGQRNKVAEEVRATISQLPLVVNDEVLRYIAYFSSGRGRNILVNGLRREGRYRPLIQRILDEEGVPQELIHLAQAESGFAPRAVSRKRAAGMWQFMLSRGEQYGLERTRSTDDRLDPEKATRAAARHLRDLYTEFGDWYLAMAAYNCGPITVQKAIERTGYADFWELRSRNVLPQETSSYLPIILAMTIIAKNPAAHGLETIVPDPPLEYSTVEIEAPTHLALIADVLECPVSLLQELNPALLQTVAPAHFLLRVPKGKDAAIISALGMVPRADRTAWRLYRVRSGDKLAGIASRYQVSLRRLAEVNQLDGSSVEEGNLLVIPAAPKPARVLTTRQRQSHRASAPRGKRGSQAAATTKPAPAETVASRRTATSRRATQAR